MSAVEGTCPSVPPSSAILNKGCDALQMKETPLIRCAHNGHYNMVQYLVEQGCDVNAIDLVYFSSDGSAIRMSQKRYWDSGTSMCSLWHLGSGSQAD